MFEEGIGPLICWLMMKFSIGSNKELVCMLMHIIGVACERLFQGWPISFPIGGIS